jgi:tRNA threonylcarbamoyladenosine biosynthesis protein TsaE
MEYAIKNVNELGELVKIILKQIIGRNIHIIALRGELGAGKTTFSQYLLAVLGAEGPYTSPTFVIMKEYDLLVADDQTELPFEKVYHFDCYRVGERDILELGWEEIIANPKNLVLIEWPERISAILPLERMEIDMEVLSPQERKLTIEILG